MSRSQLLTLDCDHHCIKGLTALLKAAATADASTPLAQLHISNLFACTPLPQHTGPAFSSSIQRSAATRTANCYSELRSTLVQACLTPMHVHLDMHMHDASIEALRQLVQSALSCGACMTSLELSLHQGQSITNARELAEEVVAAAGHVTTLRALSIMHMERYDPAGSGVTPVLEPLVEHFSRLSPLTLLKRLRLHCCLETVDCLAELSAMLKGLVHLQVRGLFPGMSNLLVYSRCPIAALYYHSSVRPRSKWCSFKIHQGTVPGAVKNETTGIRSSGVTASVPLHAA